MNEQVLNELIPVLQPDLGMPKRYQYRLDMMKRGLEREDEDSLKLVLNICRRFSVLFNFSDYSYDYSHRRVNGGSGYVPFTNEIYYDYFYIGSLYHELGHCVDHNLGDISSTKAVDQEGHTLLDILKEERDSQVKELVHSVSSVVRAEVEEKYGPHSFDNIEKHLLTHSRFLTLDKKRIAAKNSPYEVKKYLEKQQALMKKLEECGYVEEVLEKEDFLCYYQLYSLKSIFPEDDEIFCDICHSVLDMDVFCHITNHSPFYYGSSEDLLAKEFFANMMEERLSSRKQANVLLKKYFPKSIAAFDVLFEYVKNVMNGGN